jgi:hypothetical protein
MRRAIGDDTTTPMATKNQMSSELAPIDPALLDWAEAWYPVAWKGLLAAGVVTAIGACATIAFLLLQWRTIDIRERHSEWRTHMLELQTAEAQRDTARLNNETAWLYEKGRLTADAVLATAQATKANAVAAQLLLALTRQLPGIQMAGFLSAEQYERIISKVKPFAGKQFDMAVDITTTALERVSLLGSIGAAVETAGWVKVASKQPSVPPVLGVIIEVDGSKDSELLDAAKTLASALNDEGIVATVNPKAETDAANDNVIHILVGPKP